MISLKPDTASETGVHFLNLNIMKHIHFFLILLVLTACNTKPNSFYAIPDSNILVITANNGITIIAEDETRDEYGNCKSSPYSKFYEEWESIEPWTDGLERVYDAWITLDKEYYVQTIKCINSTKHKYQVINHQMPNRDSFIKYFDTNKGYGGRKGMIFNN